MPGCGEHGGLGSSDWLSEPEDLEDELLGDWGASHTPVPPPPLPDHFESS